jgi:hypothetical protein
VSLPGNVPAKLAEAIEPLPASAQESFLAHLVGGTSSEYLAGWLKRMGSPVGSTTLKQYRRNLKEIGSGR